MSDTNATACAIWALEDECLKNPAHMFQACAAPCGACSNVCEDKDKSCLAWAEEGQCESNPTAMLSLCPQSCGVCHDLELFYRTAIGGESKDEL